MPRPHRRYRDFNPSYFTILDHFEGHDEPMTLPFAAEAGARAGRQDLYRFFSALDREADTDPLARHAQLVARTLNISYQEGEKGVHTLVISIKPLILAIRAVQGKVGPVNQPMAQPKPTVVPLAAHIYDEEPSLIDEIFGKE